MIPTSCPHWTCQWSVWQYCQAAGLLAGRSNCNLQFLLTALTDIKAKGLKAAFSKVKLKCVWLKLGTAAVCPQAAGSLLQSIKTIQLKLPLLWYQNKYKFRFDLSLYLRESYLWIIICESSQLEALQPSCNQHALGLLPLAFHFKTGTG